MKTAEMRYEALEQQIALRHQRVQQMESFIANIRDQGPLTEFDENLWGVLIESITVYNKDDIQVKFRN